MTWRIVLKPHKIPRNAPSIEGSFFRAGSPLLTRAASGYATVKDRGENWKAATRSRRVQPVDPTQ